MSDTCKWRKTFVFPEYYSVSENGDVRSERNERLLKPATDKDGYLYFVLCVMGERHTIKAHRLVAMAFIDNPDSKPAIDHINGVKTDNRACNLRWVTNKENSHNALTLPKLRRNSRSNLNVMYEKSQERNFGRKITSVYKNGVLLGRFPSQKAASEFTRVSPGQVSQCMSGAKKTCKGYAFKVEEVS